MKTHKKIYKNIHELCLYITNNDLEPIQTLFNNNQLDVIDLFHTLSCTIGFQEKQITPFQLAKIVKTQPILDYIIKQCIIFLDSIKSTKKRAFFTAILREDLQSIKNLLPSPEQIHRSYDDDVEPIMACLTLEKSLYISRTTKRHFELTPYSLAYATGAQHILDCFYKTLVIPFPTMFNRFVMAIRCHQSIEILKLAKESFFKDIPEKLRFLKQTRELINPLHHAAKANNVPALKYLMRDKETRSLLENEAGNLPSWYAGLYSSRQPVRDAILATTSFKSILYIEVN